LEGSPHGFDQRETGFVQQEDQNELSQHSVSNFSNPNMDTTAGQIKQLPCPSSR
jgi:hypothetical protein